MWCCVPAGATGTSCSTHVLPTALELTPYASVMWCCIPAGAAPGIPLHEAWSLLLDGFIPLMAREALVMADLLLMYR
jgi:hypothetical protein